MKVVWTGTFDPQFSRNLKLGRLLHLIGAEVMIVREALWSGDRVGLAAKPGPGLALRAATRYPKLLWRLVRTATPDLYLVSYPGWFDVPLVHLVASLRRRPVVFDPFLSLYDTMIADRGLHSTNSMIARLARLVDRWSLRLADHVIADTEPQLGLYDRISGGLRHPGSVLPVGADDSVFVPAAAGSPRGRLAAFHGTLVPLQGVTTIVEAAALLREDGITVRIIGDGQDRPALEEAIQRTGVTVDRIEPVPLERLPALVGEASVCLGIFGESEKAGRIVPHKVFEYLALGRAVVTRDGPAIRSLFSDDELITVAPGDPVALAAEVRRLMDDTELRTRIARAGLAAYRDRFHEMPLARRLDVALQTAVGSKTRRGRRGRITVPAEDLQLEQEVEDGHEDQLDQREPNP